MCLRIRSIPWITLFLFMLWLEFPMTPRSASEDKVQNVTAHLLLQTVEVI